jgi:hypothetical protein
MIPANTEEIQVQDSFIMGAAIGNGKAASQPSNFQVECIPRVTVYSEGLRVAGFQRRLREESSLLLVP